LKPFYHINAKSFDEAVSLLKQYGDKAKVMGGGTDLIVELRERCIEANTVPPKQPQYLINLKTIPNADYIVESEGVLKIGALAKLHSIEMSSLVQQKYLLLAQAAHAVGSYQIRVMGTIAGNICQDVRCWYYRKKQFYCLRKGGAICYAVAGRNDMMHSIFGGPAGCFATNQSDMATALTALEASIVTTERTIAIKDFFINTGPGNVLKPDEIIKEILVPPVETNTKQIYIHWRPIKSRGFGIINVAAALTMSGTTCTAAKIALGGVAPTPVRAKAAEDEIKGKTINETTAEAAAAKAVTGAVALAYNKWKIAATKGIVKKTILACV
jgi:xanthine dehydrogenase YagS FAD-binding subunit